MKTTIVGICLILCCVLAGALCAQQSSPQQPMLFLTERTAVQTSAGIIELAPGTMVRLLLITGNLFTVTADGANCFDLPKEKLTERVDVDRNPPTPTPLDPALQPGRIAAATARQPLQGATRPGEGALDIVPRGVPLMSVKGVTSSSGTTIYQPLQSIPTAHAEQQRQAERQRQEQAAKRIAVNNGQNRSQMAAQQQALQRQQEQQLEQEQQPERDRQNANRAVLDDVEKTMSTMALFHQPLSWLEESSLLSSARQAAVNDFAAQQRFRNIEQQISKQRWDEQNRRMERDMNAWKNRSPDWR